MNRRDFFRLASMAGAGVSAAGLSSLVRAAAKQLARSEAGLPPVPWELQPGVARKRARSTDNFAFFIQFSEILTVPCLPCDTVVEQPARNGG